MKVYVFIVGGGNHEDVANDDDDGFAQQTRTDA